MVYFEFYSGEPIKLRMPEKLDASRTMGAKLRGQKGNSPDLHLRSLN